MPPTPTNTPLPPTPTNTPIPGSNYALIFDSTDSLEGVAISGLNGSQTIELWVRPSVAEQDGVIVATSADTDSGWSLELNGGQATWWMLNNSNSWQSVQHPTALTINSWNHIALSYNVSTNMGQLFVNGVAGPQVGVGGITVGPNLVVGGLEPYGFFTGQLDELRISDVVRYTETFTPPSAPFDGDGNTRALFGFDEGSGQTTSDRSGNGYSLTLDDPSWVDSDLFN
ncbi:hypothetical protein CJ255_03630 [Candidatus Viridilinea mediisalina]|uniref:LamG-like jellyroll fold domain-containing protein n=1 Tax=Candidatus Viridilinea mediisalina TaxID=2024553 RepID=A0A2A6RNG9_9CHLR|nr:hypothetical protein CJ255_03630 [Candidatus Viridilinea mediisalina]